MGPSLEEQHKIWRELQALSYCLRSSSYTQCQSCPNLHMDYSKFQESLFEMCSRKAVHRISSSILNENTGPKRQGRILNLLRRKKKDTEVRDSDEMPSACQQAHFTGKKKIVSSLDSCIQTLKGPLLHTKGTNTMASKWTESPPYFSTI